MVNASLDKGLSFKPQASLSTKATNYVGDPLGQTTAGWTGTDGLTCWHYCPDYYSPAVIRESYSVYIREQAKNKGKQAFEIIKVLKDKKFIDMKKVGGFIDLMDELIKFL